MHEHSIYDWRTSASKRSIFYTYKPEQINDENFSVLYANFLHLLYIQSTLPKNIILDILDVIPQKP